MAARVIITTNAFIPIEVLVSPNEDEYYEYYAIKMEEMSKANDSPLLEDAIVFYVTNPDLMQLKYSYFEDTHKDNIIVISTNREGYLRLTAQLKKIGVDVEYINQNYLDYPVFKSYCSGLGVTEQYSKLIHTKMKGNLSKCVPVINSILMGLTKDKLIITDSPKNYTKLSSAFLNLNKAPHTVRAMGNLLKTEHPKYFSTIVRNQLKDIIKIKRGLTLKEHQTMSKRFYKYYLELAPKISTQSINTIIKCIDNNYKGTSEIVELALSIRYGFPTMKGSDIDEDTFI